VGRLLEAAPDAMVCVRGDGRIALLNAQTERLFGYGRDELVGQPVEILVPDAIKAGHPALRAGYAVHPVPRPMGAGIELSGRRRDGSTFPAEISLSAIDTSGGILVMAAVRDVTEQRVLQARVGQHAAGLEWANKNLAAFTYSVAHELRTPLRGLSGFSELLLDEYADCLGETGREYATRIQSASQRMATIIDDLLQLTRVSHADVSLRPFDLSAEVAAIAAELQSREPDRRVRFVIEAGIRVTADRSLIRIVVRNLVENAWKFTALRDAATVEFGTTISDDAEVWYYVRDDGAGFDPAHAGKLFQPFQRLHAASEFPGAGVGLASAQRIIERHGGRIWARGAVDSGATFYFSLNAKGSP
jgi:PAS domain S-box-containing protein